jgi:hypothetical protein
VVAAAGVSIEAGCLLGKASSGEGLRVGPSAGSGTGEAAPHGALAGSQVE